MGSSAATTFGPDRVVNYEVGFKGYVVPGTLSLDLSLFQIDWTDIQLQDLHPKAFIRKHLLSEDDEAALRQPLEGLLDDVKRDLNGVKQDLSDVATAADIKNGTAPSASVEPTRRTPSLDLDAT